MLGESASASLHEILNFRKTTKMSWTEGQFESLCYQLVRGVMELHSSRIAHRDIRPNNIYYCSSKHGFVLGGLAQAVQVEGDEKAIGYNLCGVPYYLPNYLV